jgi:hypothetical protein
VQQCRLIRARTGEGRERAKALGASGSSAGLTGEAIERVNAGEAVVDLARSYGVNRATVYRLCAHTAKRRPQPPIRIKGLRPSMEGRTEARPLAIPRRAPLMLHRLVSVMVAFLPHNYRNSTILSARARQKPSNSPAKPPATPERIEAVLRLRDRGNE